MAISIDWLTSIISIPQSYLTFISGATYQLDTNLLRLDLKGLEAEKDGIGFLKTHISNAPFTTGGITLARQLKILLPYTITFEDGQYRVILQGTNNNILDVANINQVSIVSTNSAGLVTSAGIEALEYGRAITVDVTTSNIGVVYPVGTPRVPVNNIPDAVQQANARGFNTIKIIRNITLDIGDIIPNFIFIGENTSKTTITINTGANVLNTEFFFASVTGIMDTSANFTNCNIGNLTTVDGNFNNCQIDGIIIASGNVNMVKCRDGSTSQAPPPAIDFNSTGASLAMRLYDGDITLRNKSGPGNIEINITSGGRLTLESTITAGNIRLSGLMEIVDNSGGTSVIDTSQIVFPSDLQLSSFGGYVHINVATGFVGTKFPIGNSANPVNNFADAKIISDRIKITQFMFHNSLTLSNVDISALTFVGENPTSAQLTFGAGLTTERTTIKRTYLTGVVNGSLLVEESFVQNLTNLGSDSYDTTFFKTMLLADINASTPTLSFNNTLTTPKAIHLLECFSGVPGSSSSTLDFNSSSTQVSFRKFGGGITFDNMTISIDHTVEISQGQITLNSTCTAGTIRLGGIYKLTDNSSTVSIEARNFSISQAIWDTKASNYLTSNTMGLFLNLIKAYNTNRMDIDETNSRIIIYDEAGTTPLYYNIIKDKDNLNIVLTGTGPANRAVRT